MLTGVCRLFAIVCSSLAFCLAAQQQNRDAAAGCTGLRSYGEDSSIVFTGTVLRLDHRDGRAEVRVKRILKAPEQEELLIPDTTVRVEGVTTAPCHGDPKLRTRDSRIFMVQHSSGSSTFHLNGTLLRITVPNLDRVSAVVKGEPYHRRQPIVDLPCEKTYCPWGGECSQGRNGVTRCQCPETCPVGYAPVCGSNGATFVNECRLRRESCNRKVKIYLKHTGPCPAAPSG